MTLDGDLGFLDAAYRGELDRVGLWDRDLLRRAAAERLQRDLDAWSGEPVFAYGFEDLTGAEWALLEALAGRVEVTVSLPYEPARPAFASLRRTAEDLAALAAGRIEELPPRFDEVAHPALAHLERALFSDSSAPTRPRSRARCASSRARGRAVRWSSSVRRFSRLLRGGTAGGADRLSCARASSAGARRSRRRWATLGVPYAIDGRVRFAQTRSWTARWSRLLRFAWLGGTRARSLCVPALAVSGLTRPAVDFLEGRLRGRVNRDPGAGRRGERTPSRRLRCPSSMRCATPLDPIEAVRELAAGMLRGAHGLDSPPVGEGSRRDLASL